MKWVKGGLSVSRKGECTEGRPLNIIQSSPPRVGVAPLSTGMGRRGRYKRCGRKNLTHLAAEINNCSNRGVWRVSYLGGIEGGSEKVDQIKWVKGVISVSRKGECTEGLPLNIIQSFPP